MGFSNNAYHKTTKNLPFYHILDKRTAASYWNTPRPCGNENTERGPGDPFSPTPIPAAITSGASDSLQASDSCFFLLTKGQKEMSEGSFHSKILLLFLFFSSL